MVEFGGWVGGLLLAMGVIAIVCITCLIAYRKGQVAGFKDGARYMSDEVRKIFNEVPDDETDE